MICSECAWEADGVKSGGGNHNDIRLGNLIRRRDKLPVHGHEACPGCDCRHKEVRRPGE